MYWRNTQFQHMVSAVYHLALHKPIGISLVGHHCESGVQVMLDITVPLVIVPVDPLN